MLEFISTVLKFLLGLANTIIASLEEGIIWPFIIALFITTLSWKSSHHMFWRNIFIIEAIIVIFTLFSSGFNGKILSLSLCTAACGMSIFPSSLERKEQQELEKLRQEHQIFKDAKETVQKL